jgi:imidazole glycerol-phosphate synthase subunit HisH
MRIAIFDDGAGNVHSLEKVLSVAGDVAHDDDVRELCSADLVVLPGVGAFDTAMAKLADGGERLRDAIDDGLACLAICLGMQLLFERSHELGVTDGLGLIAGEVTRIAAGELRVPHIGFNEVAFTRPSPLTVGLPTAGSAFYHVHSFVARPANGDHVLGTCDYGELFATIVGAGSVFGTQFHPEKSSTHGLEMLGDFVALCDAGPGRPTVTSAVTRA